MLGVLGFRECYNVKGLGFRECYYVKGLGFRENPPDNSLKIFAAVYANEDLRIPPKDSP